MGWWRNRWTRRVVVTVLPMLCTGVGWAGKQIKDEYEAIPARDWVTRVDAHVARGDVAMQRFEQLAYRVDSQEKRDDERYSALLTQVEAMRKDQAELRRDLQQWFMRSRGGR